MVKYLTKIPETFVDIEDIKGNTPLHNACMANNQKVVSHLVKVCKANPVIPNCIKQKPRDMTTDPTLKCVS